MVKSTPETWLQGTLGQYLLAHEQAMFDAAVSDLFGFNAVQLGLLQLDTLKNSRIPTILHVDANAGDCLCESDYLPFAESCVDLICLPHVLEFSENPHQTLREVERILVPEGHVIITGFNPISAWGVKHAFSKDSGYPWQGHFFTISRIKDWLALLGLEYVDGKMNCYEPPIGNEKWLNRFTFMDKMGDKWWPMLGGLYLIIAKKRVVNITLLKPNWKKPSIQSRLVVNQQKNTQKQHPQQKKKHQL
jgi:SAM-dependent methyltransferase